jgi:hypothetical protein
MLQYALSFVNCEGSVSVDELPRHSVSVTGVVVREDGRVLAIQRRDDNR